MLQLLLVLGVLLGAILLVQKVLQASPRAIARKLRSGAVIFALALLVLLAASGRLHWLLVLGGAALAMGSRLLPILLQSLLYLPLLQRLWRQTRTPAGQASGANRSNVEARFVRMYLDHDSGEIGGEVLAGCFAGRRLAEMNLSELTRFYEECRTADAESAELVRAYLDRVHGEDWRRAAGANSGAGRGPGNTMSPEEAHEILGLRPGASREEIVAAHRRLIQKLHPDRGGSDYLAAKINQAKTMLLDDG